MQNIWRHWNTGLVSSRVSLTSRGEGVSLGLVGHPSSDGITIKMPYRVDVLLHHQPGTTSFLLGLVKTKFDFIVRSAVTGFGRWMLVVAVTSVDAYPFLAFFAMLVFFTNLSLMEFWVRYLALFLLFSVIGGFRWFWMKNLHKNIQLMLEFVKGPFLVLYFSYYTLMTFLMMVSVILSSMLMLLLSKCDQTSDLCQ